MNSSGASPGATKKVAALVARASCSGASHSSEYMKMKNRPDDAEQYMTMQIRTDDAEQYMTKRRI